MLLDFLSLQDDADLAHLLVAVQTMERALARLEALAEPDGYGSNVAPTVDPHSVAASVRLAGVAVTSEQVAAILAGDLNADPQAVAASRGVADALHAVLDHPGDLPLSESQLKYLQSLLLRHDQSAAAYRRQYRREGDEVATIPDQVASLVSWTRTQLEREMNVPGRLPAYLVVAVFAGRLNLIRPFAVGNGRLSRTVTAQCLAQYGYHFPEASPFELAFEERVERLSEALGRRDLNGWVVVFLEALASCVDAAVEVARASRHATVTTDRAAQVASADAFSITPRQERVLAAMSERRSAKIGDLLPALAIPRATLKKDLRGLVDAGRLASTGVRKGTVYRVLPEFHPAD